MWKALVYQWAIKYFNSIFEITALNALVSFEIKWDNVRLLWLLEKTQEQNLPSSWVHVELGDSLIWEWCFDILCNVFFMYFMLVNLVLRSSVISHSQKQMYFMLVASVIISQISNWQTLVYLMLVTNAGARKIDTVLVGDRTTASTCSNVKWVLHFIIIMSELFQCYLYHAWLLQISFVLNNCLHIWDDNHSLVIIIIFNNNFVG